MRKYIKNICFVFVLSFPYKDRSDIIKTNKQKMCLNELIYKTNLENEFIVPCGEAWGKGIIREFGMDIYTLVC